MPPIGPRPAAQPSTGPRSTGSKGISWSCSASTLSISADRRAGGGHQHEFARLIERDADEILGAHHRAVLHRPPDLALGAAPHHLERRARVGGLGHEIGQLLDRIGSVEADAHMSGHWRVRPFQRKHFAGIEQPVGIEGGLDPHLLRRDRRRRTARASVRASRCRRHARRSGSRRARRRASRISAPHSSARSSWSGSLAL